MSLLDSVAWALVNFVWQGAAIALIAFAVQRIGRLSASGRYLTGVVAMGAMLVAPVLTVARTAIVTPDRPASSAPIPPPAAAATSASPLTPAVPAAPRPAVPPVASPIATSVILVLWSAGVGVLSARLLGGWFVARRFSRRSTTPASPEIQVLARRVAARLALDRLVGVFESTAVSVPVMVGWVKPVVLLPAAAISGLSTLQVEALIAHEMAHIRRHDYLVNLLQSVVETLLFYHPAVWWVSKRMRIDRELCCDDLALEVCDRVVYATALSDLAAMVAPPRLALAATDGPLVQRVRRILGHSTERQDSAAGWLSACFVVLLAGSMAPSALTTNRPQDDPAPVTAQQAGVAGGIAIPADGVTLTGHAAAQATTEVRDPQQADAQAKADLARLRQLEQERSRIDEARTENEYRRIIAELQARIATLEANAGAQRVEFDSAQRAYEKGTIAQDALARASAKMKAAEEEIATKKADLAFQNDEVDLKRREFQIAREKALLQGAGAGADTEARAKADREFESLKLDREKQVMLERKLAETELVASRERVPEGAFEVLSVSDTIRDEDVVVIAIKGEPDLPTSFVVRDKTIRFPFVGAVKVQGLTARQVQDDLEKELVARKLAARQDVSVVVRRRK